MSHVDDVAKHAAEFATALRGVLADQRKATRALGTDQATKTAKAVQPAIAAAVNTGAQRVANVTGADMPTGDALSAVLATSFATQYTSTTSDQLDDLDDDEDPSDVFDARDGNADAVASTIVSGAINAGAQMLASSLDDDQKPSKSWSLNDDNPCPECDIDGETVGADEDFSNGAPHGPIHSNCDCSVDWNQPSESRSARKATRMADKYSSDDLKDLLAKGKAMKNDSGDPSYPVADEADIKKAVKAVGRGGADHDAIRAHIIKGAKALDLSNLIPDNWNADGSLTEEKSRWIAPQSREARADESMSFGNVQSLLYAAISAALPFGKGDIWISDCAPDWVVFHNYDQGGDFKVAYEIDADNVVTFTSPIQEVAASTQWQPVGQTNAASVVGEARAVDDEVQCPTCEGAGTIHEGNMECPTCKGDKTVTQAVADKETKSRRGGRRRQRRDLPRHGERRVYTATMEMRGDIEGNEVVLRGTPIVFDTFYGVRDWKGPFNERMNSSVIDEISERGDMDCRFLENHEGRPMGRTTNGTLVLERSAKGVEAEVRVDTRRTDSRDLSLAIERRDVTQMSCGFMVAEDGDEWRVGTDGSEERDVYSFAELFDVSAVTYPASPTTSIDMAQRMLMGVSDDTRERLRGLWHLAKDLREGKILSQQNGQDLMEALEALHEADDVDIPGIVRSLQTINSALDKGQAGISAVLGRANPDGDAGDLQPTLDPPDKAARQRAHLTLIRTRELLAV